MTIPLHYSERYVNQRYNKALQIVQYLPASSSFQPTREEKLELYAYYKQVSHGDVNTSRPGLFDMVGRAKWDAWKKLEGMDRLEARYLYTETLLQSATEAYKKNVGRATAEQIIQAFALMQPSGDRDSEGDDVTDDTTTHDEDEDDGSSIASAEAEEQAYLWEVQANATVTPRRRLVSPRQHHQQRLSWYERASSAASSMITAPTGQSRTTSPSNDRLLPHMIPQRERTARQQQQQQQRNSATYDEDSLDPWAQHTANPLHHQQQQQQHLNNDSSSDEDDQPINSSSRLRATSPRYQLQQQQIQQQPLQLQLQQQQQQQQRLINQHRAPVVQPSPVYSTSSSVTATPRNPSTLQNAHSSNNNSNNPNNTSTTTTSNRATPDPQYMSVVALGPATKRALESLQTEVIALNSRIDELRRELVIRDQRDAAVAAAAKANTKKQPISGLTLSSIPPRRTTSETSSSSNGDDDISDGWKWVIKAAAKHAAVNLITVFVLLLILYKRGSPVAYVITGQFSKLWENVKHRTLFQTVV